MTGKSTSNIVLMPHERILYESRTHWKNWMLPFIGVFLCIIGLAFRMHRFGQPLLVDFGKSFGFTPSYGTLSLVEAALIVALAVWMFARGFHHICERYVITNERLIHHAGFLNTRTTELRLLYCSNLSTWRNLPGAILGYADFGLRAGGVEMFFNDVPHPDRFHRTLADAIGMAWSQEAGTGTGNAERPDYGGTEWLEKELGLKP